MKAHNIVISSVDEGSIAYEAGIQSGDILVSVNGKEIIDIFDYGFQTARENLTVKVQKTNGEVWEIDIEKDEYEDLGLNFDLPLMDEAKRCSNKCIFCFIDQLPKGMRDSLYFKDDDSRLSFLTGNYITMTNMKKKDLDRIIKYRMSPINVSVHTTNPELRKFMLKNRFAGDIMENLKYLCNAGLDINCQIVLCRGINDGRELDRTLSDLTSLYPGIKSISVVPVGLTKYREGLFPLEPYTQAAAEEVLEQVEGYQKHCREKYGSAVVFAADEFYLLAGRPFPAYEEYEDFPQIENGVGMVSMFVKEFTDELAAIKERKDIKKTVDLSMATGVSFYPILFDLVKSIKELLPGSDIFVYDVKNDFFGHKVTVAGLLTGKDIVRQLSGKRLGDKLLLPSNMFKADSPVLLDDYTVEKLQQSLGVEVKVVNNNGRDLARAIIKG